MRNADLSKVQSGLGLVYTGLCLKILTVILAFIVGFAFAANPGPGILNAIRGLVILALIADVLTFFGMLFCLGAPSDMPGKGLIVVSFLLQIVVLIAQTVPTFNALMLIFGKPEAMLKIELPKEIDRYSQLIGLIGFVIFLVFLKSLGHYIRREELAGKAAGLLKLGAFIIVLALGTVAMLYVTAQQPGKGDSLALIILVVAIVLLVLLILFVMRYGVLLSNLRTACGESEPREEY